MTSSQPILDDEILQQAAEWFAILQDEVLSEEERQQWREWLDADSRHQQAWAQIEHISGTFESFDQDANRYAARKALSGAGPTGLNSLLALCLVCITVTLGWFTLSPQTSASDPVNYQTVVGKTQQIRLEDGTVLWLNTNSKVTTRYSESLRQIVLNQGEVLVDSAPDTQQPYRPLVVDTRNGRLTALGTRFSVRQNNDDTELTVFEGAVRIEPENVAAQVTVQTGQQGRFTRNRIKQTEVPASPAREAWVQGTLLAEDMPLCSFIEELNRYRDGEILCPADLNYLKLMGTYPLQDTDSILTAVESSLPVEFRQIGSQLWRVDKHPQKK